MEYRILKFGIYAPVSSSMHFLSGGVSDRNGFLITINKISI